MDELLDDVFELFGTALTYRNVYSTIKEARHFTIIIGPRKLLTFDLLSSYAEMPDSEDQKNIYNALEKLRA